MWPNRPIALILIAAGIALWAGKNGQLVRLSQWLQGQPERVPSELSPANHPLPFFTASQVRPSTPESVLHPALVGRSSQVPNRVLESFEPDADSAALLRLIANELRKAGSFRSDLYMELTRGPSHIEMTGQYTQLGNESGQSRIDLRIGEHNDMRELSKMCDGRFLYTLQKYRNERRLEFIDLRRIQETRSSAGLSQAGDPSSWMATGGLASLFENMAEAFRFTQQERSQRDGFHICVVDGVWHHRALVELLNSTIASHYLEPEIVWRKLPDNIPHQIRIELVDTNQLGWFPARIEFFQLDNSRKLVSLGKSSDSKQLVRIASIQFSPPQPVEIDPDRFLRLNTEDIETIDNTHLYISQLHRFEVLRQAQQSSSETLMR